MGQITPKLRKVTGGYSHWCPGCEEMHFIATEAPCEVRWAFNGNVERPNFSPSVLIRSGHHVNGRQPGNECWCTYEARTGKKPAFRCGICHYFLHDGRLQFCADSTHALAGQTVDLPDLPPEHRD